MKKINLRYRLQKLVLVLTWLTLHGVLFMSAESVANIQFFGYVFCLLHIATFLSFIMLMKEVYSQYTKELECFIVNKKNVL
jgi:hypothetical protein